jgi:hypothetical protein
LFDVLTAKHLDGLLIYGYSYTKTGYSIHHHNMQDKQKVTLYLSSDLHRQLKIRSAIDQHRMSDLAQKAISFYLSYPDVVESSGVGHTHQVHNCPECRESLVFKSGELISIGGNRSHPVNSEVNSTEHSVKQDEELAVNFT